VQINDDYYENLDSKKFEKVIVDLGKKRDPETSSG